MKAVARRRKSTGLANEVALGRHTLVSDEPREQGGEDEGPSPQELLAGSLASCMAITLEMYATRKGWDIGPVEVEVEFTQPPRDAPTEFGIVLRLPGGCSEEQRERLRTIAGKCPIHRVLEGPVRFEDRVEVL